MRWLFSILLLLVIVAVKAGDAQAGCFNFDHTAGAPYNADVPHKYWTMNSGVKCDHTNGVPEHLSAVYFSENIFGMCAVIRTEFGTWTDVPVCQIKQMGSLPGGYIVNVGSGVTMGFSLNMTVATTTDCHYTSWYSVPTTYIDAAAFAALGCQPCPTGQTFGSDNQCHAADCDDGEIFDESLGACREDCAQISMGDLYYYDYSAHACAKQCPVGKSSNTAIRFRGGAVNYDGVLSLNGCKMEAHTYCHADSTPIGDGTSCMVTFKYLEEIPTVIEMQLAYDTPTDGYQEEPAAAAANFEPEPPIQAPGGAKEYLDLGFTEGETITDVQYVCVMGAPKAIFMLEGGGSAQKNMLGTCPQVDDPFSPGTSPGEGAGIALGQAILAKAEQIEDKADAAAEKQDEAADVLDEIKELVEQVKMAVAPGEGEGETPGAFEEPETGDQYEQQHDGLASVIGTGDLGETELGAYLGSLVPSLGSAAPSCPSFAFEGLGTMGVGAFDFTPPCPFWDIAAAIMLASATFLAWLIVFRV